MEKVLVGWISGTCAAGTFTNSGKKYNCQPNLGGVGATGDYYFTLGEGGVDAQIMQPVIKTEVDVAAADIATPSLINTSDTVKRVQFRDKGGALVDPSGTVTVEFYRWQI